MKILYVTATPLEYSSSANMRNIALITGLIKQGCEVSTLSARLEENSIYQDDSLLKVKLKHRYWIDTGVLHEKINQKTNSKKELINKFRSSIIRYVYKLYTKFHIYDSRKSLVSKVKKDFIKEKFDLIISSSDPKSSHLLAEKLLKENPGIAKKWIQYWGDPFNGDINKKSWLPECFIRKEEKRLISICDAVLYVSPFTLEKQQKTFSQYASKMRFLPVAYIKPVLYPKVNNQKIILGYYGDYKKDDRNIIPLYEMAKENKISLEICGSSNLKLENTKDIKIMGRQKADVIKKLEEKVDALVCVCNLKGTQIPGKVYHYAATNKPIIIILDGENADRLKQYFESFNRYILCYNNKDSIKEAIEVLKLGQNYFPCEAFSAEKIANEVLEIYKLL